MVHRRLTPALVAVAALAAAPPTMAQTPPGSVPLDDLLGVLKTVGVRIGDHSANLIFDSGGGITVITPELAARIGCQPWGQLSGFRLSGERLTAARCDGVAIGVGGRALGRNNVGVFDLSSLLPPEAGRIDGILSFDVLEQTPFTLELGEGRLTFESAEGLRARAAEGVEIPIRLHRQAGGASLTVMARVPTAAGDLWMQLDAGSDAPLLIPPSSASAMGLDPEQARQTTTLILTGATGGEIGHPVQLGVRDMIIDGNIGIPVLKDWVMTFDLANERLWMRPAV